MNIYQEYINPMIPLEFMEWVKNNHSILKDKTFLEIGGGKSTIFFSKYFKKVYTYENKIKYFDLIKKDLQNNNIKNVDLIFFNNSKIFQNPQFLKLTESCDYILIDVDDLPRHEFAYFIHHNKKPSSSIILSKGNRNMHSYKFLKDNYYCFDFIGQDDFGIYCTTLFHLRIDDKTKIFR